MEQIFITESQKDKLKELADRHPEPVALARFAGSLMRQGLVHKVTPEGEKPSRHMLTGKGIEYLTETLHYKVGTGEG